MARRNDSSSSGGSGDSGSDTGSSGTGSAASSQGAAQVTQDDAKRVPPITLRKLELRNKLAMFQVDEEYEEEKYTLTGQTATDVVLPNIREVQRGNTIGLGVKRQLPNV